MNASKTITVTYSRTDTEPREWTETVGAHARMMEILVESERRWQSSSKDIDCLRFACTDTLIAVATFVKRMGVTQFASERLDEVVQSFARANWGQSTPLLNRAKFHPGSLSPIDRMYQGAGQACVELYTAARVPVGQARTRAARLFALKGVKGLGVETLVKLGSRLSGKNARKDSNYDYYRMAMDFARYELARRGGTWPPTESQADNVAKAVVRMTLEQDRAPK